MENPTNQLVVISLDQLQSMIQNVVRTELKATTTTQMTTPKWLTTAEAANQLCVSPKTIRDWCNDGKLKHRRVGKKILIHEQTLKQ